jgi:predicted negative regulator of RcsB-dependent stress response
MSTTKILVIGGAIVVAYLGYRWWTKRKIEERASVAFGTVTGAATLNALPPGVFPGAGALAEVARMQQEAQGYRA